MVANCWLILTKIKTFYFILRCIILMAIFILFKAILLKWKQGVSELFIKVIYGEAFWETFPFPEVLLVIDQEVIFNTKNIFYFQ